MQNKGKCEMDTAEEGNVLCSIECSRAGGCRPRHLC